MSLSSFTVCEGLTLNQALIRYAQLDLGIYKDPTAREIDKSSYKIHHYITESPENTFSIHKMARNAEGQRSTKKQQIKVIKQSRVELIEKVCNYIGGERVFSESRRIQYYLQGKRNAGDMRFEARYDTKKIKALNPNELKPRHSEICLMINALIKLRNGLYTHSCRKHFYLEDKLKASLSKLRVIKEVLENKLNMLSSN